MMRFQTETAKPERTTRSRRLPSCLVNLYGRAVGLDGVTPKEIRHDHLPGPKGYFNAAGLVNGDGPLLICEGPFDALGLIAAGYPAGRGYLRCKRLAMGLVPMRAGDRAGFGRR